VFDNKSSRETYDAHLGANRIRVDNALRERDRLSTKNSVQINNTAFTKLWTRALDRSLNLSVAHYNDTVNVHVNEKPNARADQIRAKEQFRMLIRFQSGFWYRCQTRSRRGPSQHRSCRLHVLHHCMHHNCHWDGETIRKRV
jgi:hypothetical protein